MKQEVGLEKRILKLRQQVDLQDQAIAKAIVKRTSYAQEILQLKGHLGMGKIDRRREGEICNHYRKILGPSFSSVKITQFVGALLRLNIQYTARYTARYTKVKS